MTTNIQRLTSASANVLTNIAPEVFDNPIVSAALQAFLDDPRHIMFVALERDTVIGMVSGFEYFHPDKQPQMFINEVGVAETHRRRGIGRKLVETMINHAELRGCAYAWLGTDRDNKAAQACFASIPGTEAPQEFLLYEWDLED